MKGIKQVIDCEKKPAKAEQAIGEAEVIFCLDFNDLERIGELGKLVAAASVPKVMIDHHLEPALEVYRPGRG